jgi:sterol desaturase/sphingolipid hydroxylase (fatty acid hydroxylase superfamily)
VLFLGYHQQGFFLVTFINLFFLYIGHVRLNLNLGPLGHIFVGPRFHHVHHSTRPEHVNRNFAQFFPFLDRIFGTYATPESINDVRTGVPECTTRRDQWLPMIWPFGILRAAHKRPAS